MRRCMKCFIYANQRSKQHVCSAIKDNIKRSLKNVRLLIVSLTNLNFGQPLQKMKKLIHIPLMLLLSCALFLIPSAALAQPEDPCTDPDLPCPIDSNLMVLIAVAVGVAAKKTISYKGLAKQI